MPDPALPQPLGRPAPQGGGEVVSGVFLRCPRGARISPPDTAGDHFCSICDCGRRTDSTT